MGTLILLRHGESQYNMENRFTGWFDVELSEHGWEQVHQAGEAMKRAQIAPDIAFTSFLRRAIHTQQRVLDELGRSWIPEFKSWRLNERHYGGLQDKNKKETAAEFGDDQVHIWRRSYNIRPPLMAFDDPRHPRFDPRYKDVPGLDGDFVESLEDTIVRTLPYFLDYIMPEVKEGKTVLVTAHGNSLRGIIKYLENIPDADIPNLELPTAEPYVYHIDAKGKIIDKKILQ